MALIDLNFLREVGVTRFFSRTLYRQFYKRVLRKDQRMRLPTGDMLLLPRTSRFASEAFVTGADVDWGSEKLFFMLANRSLAFLDIGANIGYYALYMRPGVSFVYAFEPDPRMFELLTAAIAEHRNVLAVPNAVGKVAGKAKFTLESGGEVSHLARVGDIGAGTADVEVDVVTVDAFVKQHGIVVASIKTDVEGFDLEVLEGAMRTMELQRPIVLSEIQPSAALDALLAAVRYRACAYIRDVRTRAKSFEHVNGALPPERAAKMLFLVPEERIGDVTAAAARLQV